MKIIEVITKAIDPTEVLSKEEGDNKVIIEDNIKATMENLTLIMVAITIITRAIITAKEAMAMVVLTIDHMVMEEAVIEAIIIINNINITHMMMDNNLNNMVHRVLFVEFQSFS